MDLSEVLVVIRSSGERTKDVCFQCLNKYFSKENIIVVENYSPFSEAIKVTFQKALIQNKKWTLVVDADVLVNDNIVRFIEECDKHLETHKKTYVYNPFLYDKFLMMYRIVGIHLYNTKYLKKALKYIDKCKCELRPETYIKKEMHIRGYNSYYSNSEVGVHDFFQYHKDIFRKGILHANKHVEIDDVYERWKNLRDVDVEYFWICEGVEASKKISEDIIVDINFFEKYAQGYKENEVVEKSLDVEEVRDIIKKYKKEDDVKINKTWSRWILFKQKYL